MIDFHSHILPGMDDGSKNENESLQMLKRSAEQGIGVLALTPHFYADRDTPESFLERRAKSYEKLSAVKIRKAPQLLLGAEVKYFSGIHKAQAIHQLRLQGTKYLLLEMPFSKWTQRMLDEISELNQSREIDVVIAHIDRCLSMQKRGVIESLLSDGICFQANADCFLNWRKRGKMLRMLESGYISFLGSDCHNLTDRPPQIGEALEVISKKLGAETVEMLKKMSL